MYSEKNPFRFDHHAQFSLELFDKSVNNWDFLKIQFQFFLRMPRKFFHLVLLA